MTYALEVKGVSKKYKGFGLEDISFELPAGYIMGLIGPNGSGKTTLIKLIMNLAKKDSGSILVFGKDHIEHEVQVKEQIGFVYDENYFYEDFTLDRMKKVYSRFYKTWNEDLYQKYSEQFELRQDKKIKELSKGMKTKFALALALAHQPKLILMDEPTAGLDPVFRSELMEILLEQIQNEQTSILFSTHITSDLERVADYITFINKGKLVFSKAKDEIFDTYKLVKGGNELLDSGKLSQYLIGVKKTEYGFEALTDQAEAVEQLLGSKVILEKPTLDDIMVFVTKGKAAK